MPPAISGGGAALWGYPPILHEHFEETGSELPSFSWKDIYKWHPILSRKPSCLAEGFRIDFVGFDSESLQFKRDHLMTFIAASWYVKTTNFDISMTILSFWVLLYNIESSNYSGASSYKHPFNLRPLWLVNVPPPNVPA